MPEVSPLQAQLANEILDFAMHRVGPGGQLTEASCAERFAVSRTPVRGALRLLVARGALEPLARGYRVNAARALEAARADLPPCETDQLLHRLVDDYLDGAIASTVSENELGERYGATRGITRAALLRLAEQGVVVRARGHGWSFQDALSGEQADLESFRLRLLLEPAGLLEPTFKLDRPRLEAALRAQESVQAKARPPAERVLAANAEFHQTLADLSGNRFISQIYRMQSARRRLFEYRGYRDTDRMRAAFAEHIRIGRTLLAGDNAKASVLMREHLSTAMKRRLSRYKAGQTVG